MTTDPIIKRSARWFWWIAGLSLVNAVLSYSGSDFNFVLGLAMTMMVSGMFAQTMAVGVVIVAIIIGFYFAIGYFAQAGKLWAYWVGLAVYVVDALIYAKFEDWMPVGFHALAGFYIVKGAMRVMELKRAGVAPA